ncbi:Prohibitin [Geodia barretti]|uniref:Prohibitin n=1 Tax=Geodia barretti TaxID=519541 RepID=A0AA35SCG5_GEOBA|nr:Prohibitin [Geodia barretti]
MALNRLMGLGVGLAVAGAVVKSTLYNDLQNVDITLRILFRPDEKSLPWIFTNIGVDFDEKILPSIANEVLKGVVAEQVKQAAVISSSGDSQAAELVSKAFEEAGEGLIELRRLEAAEDIATSLSKSRNVAYLPGWWSEWRPQSTAQYSSLNNNRHYPFSIVA